MLNRPSPRPLDPEFYRRPVLQVAADLLNKVLVDDAGRQVRLVEVEAYGGADDPGSHSYRGRTARNQAMWGPPGRLYVYFVYGMHWCANVVCQPPEEPAAVLFRAGEPLAGLAAMRAARWPGRPPGRDLDLCRGPARLCQAMGLDGADTGRDLAPPGIWLADDGTFPPAEPLVTGRIGLSRGAELPWRLAVPGSVWPSRAPGARPV